MDNCRQSECIPSFCIETSQTTPEDS